MPRLDKKVDMALNEFSSIVGLKALGNRVQLSLNMGNKVNKVTIDFGFLA